MFRGLGPGCRAEGLGLLGFRVQGGCGGLGFLEGLELRDVGFRGM